MLTNLRNSKESSEEEIRENMRVKIRGIYATALTKLLRDRNFEIADPSDPISDRFNLDEASSGADILIYDKEDLNGVTINGCGCEEVVRILKESFDDVFVRKIEIGTIYRGKIKRFDQRSKNIVVELGNGKQGLLPLQSYWGYLREGEKVLVQTKGVSREFYLLSTQLRIFGTNLVLIKNGFTKVSKHLRDPKEVERLMSLSKEAKLRGYGVLWKALAQGKSDEELKKEMNELFAKEEEIRRKFEEDDTPGPIEKGLVMYFIDFGPEAKRKLDEIRSQVLPTIPGHHELKSFEYMELVDLVDSLLGKVDQKILEESVLNLLEKNFPKVGASYLVIHKKLNGKNITIRGQVEEFSKDLVKLRRTIRYRGSYDGLNLKTEAGDFAITKFKKGGWFILHEYYNSDGVLKGRYFSINTPIEVSPKFSRYIDLEIDVIEGPEGRKIVDREKLDLKFQNGFLNEKIYKKAIEIAEKIAGGEINGP